jgi:hypothetical protein
LDNAEHHQDWGAGHHQNWGAMHHQDCGAEHHQTGNHGQQAWDGQPWMEELLRPYYGDWLSSYMGYDRLKARLLLCYWPKITPTILPDFSAMGLVLTSCVACLDHPKISYVNKFISLRFLHFLTKIL